MWTLSQQRWGLKEDRHEQLGPCRLRTLYSGSSVRQCCHHGTDCLGPGARRPISQDLLPVRATGSRKPSLNRGLYAMQPCRMQTNFSCHLCPGCRTPLWRSWQLHGQCQILWLLRVPLPENCKFPNFISKQRICLIFKDICAIIKFSFQNKKIIKTIPAFKPQPSTVAHHSSDEEANAASTASATSPSKSPKENSGASGMNSVSGGSSQGRNSSMSTSSSSSKKGKKGRRTNNQVNNRFLSISSNHKYPNYTIILPIL
jgi:hypothetical protein